MSAGSISIRSVSILVTLVLAHGALASNTTSSVTSPSVPEATDTPSATNAVNAPPAAAPKALRFEVVDSNFESTEKIVIDADSIKKSRSTSVAQVLSNQANINIVSTNFQPNSVFIRGGDSSHVLVLIDDVPTYDATTLQKTVNLSNINLANVKRIEVLKGSQAVLYGGQALSAVIKIYTIPTEIKDSAQVKAQVQRKFGSDTALNANKTITENSMISFDARYASLKNPSPVLNSAKTEGYPQKIASTQLGYAFKSSEDLKALVKLNYSRDDNEISTTNTGSAAADVDGFESDTETLGATLVVQARDSWLASVSAQQSERQLKLDSANPRDAINDEYDGELVNARIEGQADITRFVNLRGGASFANESASTYRMEKLLVDDIRQQNEGYFGKVSILPLGQDNKNVTIEGGYRTEYVQGKNPTETMQLGFTAMENLKLEISTGSRRPSLSQRFDPTYGNANLQNEKATTLNASYQHQFSNSLTGSVAVFDSNYRNLIDCVGNSRNCKMTNINAARTTGAEVSANLYNEVQGLGLRGFLGYQEPKDLSTGNWLFRRPLRTAGVQLKKDWSDRFDSMIEAQYTGSRTDRASRISNQPVTLSEYVVVNLSANFKVQDDLDVFGRIDNLQDKTYETTFGYYVQGAEVRAGLEKRF